MIHGSGDSLDPEGVQKPAWWVREGLLVWMHSACCVCSVQGPSLQLSALKLPVLFPCWYCVAWYKCFPPRAGLIPDTAIASVSVSDSVLWSWWLHPYSCVFLPSCTVPTPPLQTNPNCLTAPVCWFVCILSLICFCSCLKRIHLMWDAL